MSFISNNVDFGIVSDSEITSIISNFSDDMIMDIIYKNSANKFRPYQHYVGNLVGAIETTFRTNLENYPEFQNETIARRNEVYLQILNSLCTTHGLTLNIDENTDLYSLAFVLYDFTISKFTINMINFFTNYILSETNTLYEYLNLRELKKNKDNSSSYSKKIFKGNSKLATIHANLEVVIDAICAFDISLGTLVSVSTADMNVTSFITNSFNEVSSLFKVLFVPYINDPRYRANIITLVRMRLQELEATTDLSMATN